MKEQSFFEKWSKVIKKMPLGKRPLLEGRGEKPDTSKPDIDEGKWDKEFVDEYKSICGYCEEVGICLEKTDIQELFETYINGKVKIKCKNGCILIERIK